MSHARSETRHVTHNPFDLTGKVALVTGAGRGLGLAIATALAHAGADIAIAELDESSARAAAQSLAATGRKTFAVQCDVTDRESVQHAVDASVKALDHVDVLVANAGISIWDPAERVTPKDWQKVIDVNLTGVFNCCQAVGNHMIARGRGGSLINIASMSAQIVNIPQCQAAYNASKAGVVQLTRSLSLEWVSHNIRVNSISPGIMATSMTQTHFDNPDIGPQWLGRIPMGRPGKPEELGPLAVYLASDASSYMTGSDIIIDGGYTLA